jgi:sodium transport system permease protein
MIGAVFRKEMLDSFRDRRSMLSMLLFPLVGPLIVALMFTRIVDQHQPDRTVELPVVGRAHAPALIAYLERYRVKVVEAPGLTSAAHAVQAVKLRTIDLALLIDANFERDFRDGKPAMLDVVVDSTRNEAASNARRVTGIINQYASSIGVRRLLARGVSPQLARPVTVRRLDVATAQQRAARLLNLIPMFVLIASFLGGMYCATDATAGERERGSLEPLLLTPAPRHSLVIGKWLAATVFSVVTVVLTLCFTLLVLSRVPLQNIDVRFDLTFTDVMGLLLAVVPLSFFATGSQLLIATFARNFKEAQTYLSLMIFLPMLPGMIFMLEPLRTELWMTAIPVLGQQAILSDVISGEPVRGLSYVMAALASAAAGLVCVYFTARLFSREQIIC